MCRPLEKYLERKGAAGEQASLTLPSPPNKKNLPTERQVFRAAVGMWMRTGSCRPFQPHLLWTRHQPVGGQAGCGPGLHDSFGLLWSAAFQGPWPSVPARAPLLLWDFFEMCLDQESTRFCRPRDRVLPSHFLFLSSIFYVNVPPSWFCCIIRYWGLAEVKCII